MWTTEDRFAPPSLRFPNFWTYSTSTVVHSGPTAQRPLRARRGVLGFRSECVALDSLSLAIRHSDFPVAFPPRVATPVPAGLTPPARWDTFPDRQLATCTSNLAQLERRLSQSRLPRAFHLFPLPCSSGGELLPEGDPGASSGPASRWSCRIWDSACSDSHASTSATLHTFTLGDSLMG